jgi:HK97 family phage major capsid protein
MLLTECVSAPASMHSMHDRKRFPMELKTLIEQRNKLIADAGAIAQNKDASKEQRAQIKTMFVTIDKLQEDIDIAKRMEGFKEENRSSGVPPRGQPGDTLLDVTPERNELEKRAFKNFVTGRLKPEDHQYLKRDLTVGAPGAVSGGGVLVPVGYDNVLHTATKATGEILSGVRTWNTDSGEAIRVSTADPTAVRFTLTAENTASGETDPSFGGFSSNVDTLTLMTKVSNQLLQDSAFSIEQFLSETINTAWVNTASEAIILGNASNFQSLVTATPVGYTAPVGSASTISYDSLINFYSKLDPSYLAGAALWMNSRTWASLLDVKDANQRPILTTDFQGAPFKSFLGLPIRIAQKIDDLGANKSPILLGDAVKSYTYRQAGPLVLRKSVDRYLEFNATAFFSAQRAGGYTTIQASSPSMIKFVMSAT